MCQDQISNYFYFLACKYPTFYAILISASLTAIAVYITIKQSRKTAREKNSIDFETSYKTNSDIVEAWKVIRPLMAYKSSCYLNPSNKLIKPEEVDAINLILNTWERASNGIFHSIYDGLFLYKTYGSTVLYLYVKLYPFIASRQSENPRFYLQFTKLYIDWRIRRQQEDRLQLDDDLKSIYKQLQKSIKQS